MTLQEKIDSTPDGYIVKLDKDYEEAVVISERDITVDLNGHTLTAPEGECPMRVEYSKVSLYNGTISAKKEAAVRVGVKDAIKGTKLMIDPHMVLESDGFTAMFILARADVTSYGTIRATVGDSGADAAIQGNGTAPYFGNSLHIMGGVVESTDGQGIYWPQEGDLTIASGKVSGITGIEIRAGKLTVTGGTIVGTGAFSSKANGNGFTTSGAGIAVTQHTTRLPIMASVGGYPGAAIVEGAVGLYEGNPQGNPAEALGKVGMMVSNGIIRSTSDMPAVQAADVKGFIQGGMFNTALPAELMSDGFEIVEQEDGSFSALRVAWQFPDGGAVGGGLLNMRRLLMSKPRLTYTAGGFEVPVAFEPLCLLSVTARGGGITGFYDRTSKKVVLYKDGAEASGVIEDISIMMIGA